MTGQSPYWFCSVSVIITAWIAICPSVDGFRLSETYSNWRFGFFSIGIAALAFYFVFWLYSYARKQTAEMFLLLYSWYVNVILFALKKGTKSRIFFYHRGIWISFGNNYHHYKMVYCLKIFCIDIMEYVHELL